MNRTPKNKHALSMERTVSNVSHLVSRVSNFEFANCKDFVNCNAGFVSTIEIKR